MATVIITYSIAQTFFYEANIPTNAINLLCCYEMWLYIFNRKTLYKTLIRASIIPNKMYTTISDVNQLWVTNNLGSIFGFLLHIKYRKCSPERKVPEYLVANGKYCMLTTVQYIQERSIYWTIVLYCTERRRSKFISNSWPRKYWPGYWKCSYSIVQWMYSIHVYLTHVYMYIRTCILNICTVYLIVHYCMVHWTVRIRNMPQRFPHSMPPNITCNLVLVWLACGYAKLYYVLFPIWNYHLSYR